MIAPAIFGGSIVALAAAMAFRNIRAERSDARALRAVEKLLGVAYAPHMPEDIHPDQDCTGDMPELSPVAKGIREAQARKYGGDRELRFTRETRWRAPRLVSPNNDAPKRDWC